MTEQNTQHLQLSGSEKSGRMGAEDKLHEECGVFGFFDPEGSDVAPSIYYGLCALQHRGQESCGIAVCDTAGAKGNMNVHRGMGLVNEVFGPETISHLHGISESAMSAIPPPERLRWPTPSRWFSTISREHLPWPTTAIW